MQAMILAAGLGKRMLPLTNSIPKPLIKLGGKSLIEYGLNNLSQAGVKQVIINVHHLSEQIKAALEDGSKWGVDIKYSEELILLDTGGAVIQAIEKKIINNQEPLIITSADIITKFDFRTLRNKLTKLAHLILVPNPVFHPQGDFSLDGDLLVGKEQVNMHAFSPSYTYANIGVFHLDFFKGNFERVFPLSKLINKYLNQQKITAEFYTGPWKNIGTVEDLKLIDYNVYS